MPTRSAQAHGDCCSYTHNRGDDASVRALSHLGGDLD